jgi:hypothetical protein
VISARCPVTAENQRFQTTIALWEMSVTINIMFLHTALYNILFCDYRLRFLVYVLMITRREVHLNGREPEDNVSRKFFIIRGSIQSHSDVY